MNAETRSERKRGKERRQGKRWKQIRESVKTEEEGAASAVARLLARSLRYMKLVSSETRSPSDSGKEASERREAGRERERVSGRECDSQDRQVQQQEQDGRAKRQETCACVCVCVCTRVSESLWRRLLRRKGRKARESWRDSGGAARRTSHEGERDAGLLISASEVMQHYTPSLLLQQRKEGRERERELPTGMAVSSSELSSQHHRLV